MSRCRFLLTAAALVLSACGGTDVAAPSRGFSSASRAGGVVPGSVGKASTSLGVGPLACDVPATLHGGALIGPGGGTIQIGPHRFIVPAGALSAPTYITATVPQGNSLEADFEPTGLHFSKPASLVFNVSGCAPIVSGVFVRSLEDGVLIPATYSTWWHTVAAPIEHFSGYMLSIG